MPAATTASEAHRIFEEVREGYNQAQHGVVDSVVRSVPSFVSDLKGCVGDFGIDVSINPANWLSSILDNLNSLNSLCEGDFDVGDIDMGGGDDPFDGGGGGSPSAPEPYFISVLPDSGAFTQKMYEYMVKFWDDERYYPVAAVDESNNIILDVAFGQPARQGLATLTSSLNQLKRAFDDFDCNQFIYYVVTRDEDRKPVYRNVNRCKRVHEYFEDRRLYLLSTSEAAVQASGAQQ